MRAYTDYSKGATTQLEQLKQEQQSCFSLLMECLALRDSHPEYRARLDNVINNVESVMSRKADLLAKMEATVKFPQMV